MFKFKLFQKILNNLITNTETIELYGNKATQSKTEIFYTVISRPILFNQYKQKISIPTSTTSQLPVITIHTPSKGMILELKTTSETATFYSG